MHISKKSFEILLTFLIFSISTNGLTNCLNHLRIVKKNDFKTFRGLGGYLDKFLHDIEDIQLLEDLNRLNNKSHIFDMGCGDCNFALDIFQSFDLREYHWDHERFKLRISENDKLASKPIKQKPNITGVTYKLGKNKSKVGKFKNKLHVFDKNFLHDISNDELTKQFGLADMIIDNFGVLSYSEDISRTLNKYISISKVGAIWYIYGASAKIILLNGVDIPLRKWLKTFSNSLDVQFLDSTSSESVIRVKVKKKFKFPSLELIDFEEGAPPYRTYQEF